jgi:Nif-specific regulatory protein
MKKSQPEIKNRVNELSLLFDISQILDKSIEMKGALHPILKTIAREMGMLRGTLTLFNRNTKEISIEVAYGLTENQKRRGIYRVGEGITGKVVQGGVPLVIPRISEEPLFLDRTRARRDLKKSDISFICVPIKIEQEVIGTLSIDRIFDESAMLDEDTRLLAIIASMIAQAVRLRQSTQEEKLRLLKENIRLHEELKVRFRPSSIIGNSHGMQQVYKLIQQVCKTDTTAILRGETGVGKELVAQAIHYNSLRADQPFIKVNCAALPESVIESELFGHEKGAFTGAVAKRKGRFELAQNGTLFLDEIGDISPAMQIKLLRVLQEKEFERVGGIKVIKTNIRIITATNRNLEKLITEEKFRQDLYYRLNVFPIHIPPLRERKADLLLLTDHLVEKYNRIHNKNIKRISTPAIDMLTVYHWPGNVRELENCIERAVLISNDEVIHSHNLPPTLQTGEASGTKLEGTLSERLNAVERELIIEALKEARGNMTKAAIQLGITERIMGLRVKKFKINYRRFRAHTPHEEHGAAKV